ncbi:DUF4139 domain-containing protein [Streptomyces sp. NBC_00868]|uniref:hypothetical protein n=1 Tax=unclassified Streptomyces TaxID=2593676 RepID=UPI0032551EF0|nr:DUF4139 domain-containing protein [Streptomyces sp. NBC_00868]
MSRNPAPVRAARAAMFAAVCTALGAVGHSSMSSSGIPLTGLLGAFGVTGGLAWLAAGRRRGPVGIAAAVLTVQAALHLVFSGSQAAPASGAMTGDGPVHGMDMGATDMGSMDMSTMDMGAMAAGTSGGMADMAVHGGAGMIAAHALAGLFCAAWLARGEAAVFRLARILGAAALHAARPLSRALALLRARVTAPADPPAFRPRRPYERPRRLRGAVHAHAVVRRGPPAGRTARTTAPGRPACA